MFILQFYILFKLFLCCLLISSMVLGCCMLTMYNSFAYSQYLFIVILCVIVLFVLFLHYYVLFYVVICISSRYVLLKVVVCLTD